MDKDERFKHLASDPRFKQIRKKTVPVDERFVLDDRFKVEERDKRGFKRRQNKLPRAEAAEDPQDEEENPDNCEEEVVINDEREIEQISSEEKVEEEDEEEGEDSEVDGESDAESEISTSSDEPETDDDDRLGASDIERIQYDWQPLDHDAETTEESSRRLAIQNLDWDRMGAKDIYALVNSARPPLNVRIYISEFGKERIAREEKEGPEELADLVQVDEEEKELEDLQKKMKELDDQSKPRVDKKHRTHEYEDADEVGDPKNEELRERIRRYQLSKMKYYYAIAEFDSAETAEAVYKELDGKEYEGSSLELDLRFVPDDMSFDSADLRDESSQAPDPATYKAPQFINCALQQTTVRLTWDETDIKRKEELFRAHTKGDLDNLEAYLGSDTESEEGDGGASAAARADKYKLLLESIEGAKEKKVDAEVVWDEYEADETSASTSSASTVSEASEASSASRASPVSPAPALAPPAKDNDNDFVFNPDDDRFKAVYESGLYNIDPSHPSFKRTKAFERMAEKKRSKRQRVQT